MIKTGFANDGALRREPFLTAIATSFPIRLLLMYSSKVLYIDSSLRRKNAAFAPMTIVAARRVFDLGACVMSPGADAVSGDVNVSNLKFFLEKLSGLVEEEARRIRC